MLRRNRNSYLFLIIAFSLFCTSCNNMKAKENPDMIFSTEPQWGDKISPKTTELLTIGKDDFADENYFFSAIADIKIDDEGFIYILDAKNCRVQKFSKTGQYILSFGQGKGQGPAQFLTPMQITFDSMKNLYVTDMDLSRITIFDASGKLLKTIKAKTMPYDIIVGKNGNIYISSLLDMGKYRINVYSFETGRLVTSFCENRDDTELEIKSGNTGCLGQDKDGNIYYSFCYPYEIRKFSPEGKLLRRFNRKADFFELPKVNKRGAMSIKARSMDLEIFPDGKILNIVRDIQDLKARKVIFYFDLFSRDGKWLSSFSSTAFNNDWIRYIALDVNGNLYMDFSHPYPFVKKFSLEFIEKK